MRISGIGVISSRGRGMAAVERALEQGWKAPEMDPLPIYRVEPEALKDKALFRKIRRADRFTKMAVFAASDAVKDAGLDSTACADMGIILATAFGPHATTFQFLDDIIDYGEKEVSPTKFSHSVHNAAAFYVASVVGCRGPALTVTNFAFSFHHALVLAQAWLDSGRFQHVLVGAVDESQKVMEYIFSRKLSMAQDGKIRPFDCALEPHSVPGEGSTFFVVSKDAGSNDYARFSEISWSSKTEDFSARDVVLWEADGMAGSEKLYGELQASHNRVGSFAPIFGGSLTLSAFHAAAGALMLRGQKSFPVPVESNPLDLALCHLDDTRLLEEVACARVNCGREIGWIKLQGVPK